MPRPQRCRMIGNMPKVDEFIPNSINDLNTEKIVMTVDEYETIKLIDYEGMNQEECANSMQVARTTVQLIYNSAQAIVEGKNLVIRGGCYKLLNNCNGRCRRKGY